MCSSELEEKSNKLLLCTKCKYKFWQNPKPATSVLLLNKRDEILLVKRAHDPSMGLWDMPGGFIDPGENLEESTLRELEEELGAKFADLEYLFSFSDEYRYEGINYGVVVPVFGAKMETEILILNEESTGYKWFAKDSIPWENLAFDGMKKALKRYLNACGT
jgi:ADP-ribose pyrophosphatase YjhB (NUDIX family)